MWIATSKPRNELEDPSKGTRIFLILITMNKNILIFNLK